MVVHAGRQHSQGCTLPLDAFPLPGPADKAIPSRSFAVPPYVTQPDEVSIRVLIFKQHHIPQSFAFCVPDRCAAIKACRQIPGAFCFSVVAQQYSGLMAGNQGEAGFQFFRGFCDMRTVETQTHIMVGVYAYPPVEKKPSHWARFPSASPILA